MSRPRLRDVDERVRVLVREGLADRDAITQRILEEATHDELLAIVRPVVAWQVSLSLRVGAPRPRSPRATAAPTTADPVTVVDELRNLLDQTFQLEDGTRVTWRAASVEQHQRRAAMLRALSERASMTADRHEHAARLIAESRGGTLADALDEPANGGGL